MPRLRGHVGRLFEVLLRLPESVARLFQDVGRLNGIILRLRGAIARLWSVIGWESILREAGAAGEEAVDGGSFWWRLIFLTALQEAEGEFHSRH